MDLSHWMANCAAIQHRPLRRICLPASRHSASYGLTDQTLPGPGCEHTQVFEWIRTTGDEIARIPGIDRYIHPARWLMDAVLPAIRGAYCSTSLTVLEQLRSGIRCLDFRVGYDTRTARFLTTHGLVGPALSEVLSDIAAFMQDARGELVVVTFSHGATRDVAPGAVFPHEALWAEIAATLGDFTCTSTEPDGQGMRTLFDKTLSEILRGTAAKQGAVVLIDGNSDGDRFPALLRGGWKDTSDVEAMVADQRNRHAASGGQPFALHLTLTPQQNEIIAIMAASLAPAIAQLSASFSTVIPPIAAALGVIAAGLSVYGRTLEWTSLQELSTKVNARMEHLLANEFPLDERAPFTCVYGDFSEASPLVECCIAINAGTVASHVDRSD